MIKTKLQQQINFFYELDSNSPLRYKLSGSLYAQAAFNFLYALSSDMLILFVLVGTQQYQALFYNMSATKLLTMSSYKLQDPNRLGQVDEVSKKAYIFQQTKLMVVDLTSFTQVSAGLAQTCVGSYIFNSDFSILYLQDLCGGEGFYSYPNPVLKMANSPANTNIYTYNWYGKFLVFKSFNLPQIFYDSQNNILFRVNSVHGNNNGGFIQDSQAVFFNNLAVDHYDISTFRFLFSEDNGIPFTFLLQTQKLRNNYAISTKLNVIQVKKFNELVFNQQSFSSAYYYLSYIPETNMIILQSSSKIMIYDSITKKLLKQLNISNGVSVKSNFATQEGYVKKTFYYQPSNIIVLVLFKQLLCINATTLASVKIDFIKFNYLYHYQYYQVFQYDISTNLPFKSIVIDMELGYLIYTDITLDCIFNLNTLTRTCQQEVSTYVGLPNQPMFDYTQELFINQKTKMLVICQMTSIRVLSLRDLKYKGSIYDTALDAAQFFYNPYYNYVIYSQQKGLIFTLLDLNTMSKKTLSLPAPSKDFQSINYRFLSDQQNYIHVNSNYLAIQTYNQQTHKLVNSIQLDIGFFPYSNWVIDEDRKFIFIIDTSNSVQHLSYDTNKLIYKYQLNSTDIGGTLKTIIWDTYKQKIIVSSINTFYVISVLKNLIEFQYFDDNDLIIQTQFIPNKNILYFSTYSSWSIFDYDYLVNDNKDTFPNQIQPRSYLINDNVVFHINDVNSQANLYVNKKVKDSWIRNNLMVGYIRMAENDLQNYLIYAIFDKEISILDLSQNKIVQIDQLFHTQNIISILYEDNTYVYLHSQSQQLLTLSKKSKAITLNEVITLSQGIATYYFTKNSMQLIFSEITSNLNINIVNFTFDQGKLKGTQSTPIKMASRIVHFNVLDDPQIVILLEDTLIVYDIVALLIVQSIALPIRHIFSNVQVDLINKRIFVQNQNTGSLVYDFNLSQTSQLSIFSSNIQFDQYFIYSITGHSANIYFRKDLQFLTNFRHFEMSFNLKRIVYLGVGYLFMVEFLTKLSVYELSPFGNLPIEKDFININQFNIYKYSLTKVNNDPKDSSYMFVALGFTLEGQFTYSSKIFQYNQQAMASCSWSVPMQQQIYQEANVFNQLAQQLTSQSRTLNRLSVPISSGQYLRLPQVPSSIIGNKFDLSIVGNNDYEKIFVKDSLQDLSTITDLKLKKVKLTIDPSKFSSYVTDNKIPNSIDINSGKYPNLKSFMIENTELEEVSLQIDSIPSINIKNIILSSIKSNNNIESLTYLKLSNSQSATISTITINKSDFSFSKPLIDIRDIEQVTIKQIIITEGNFSSLSSIISIQNVKTLIIEDIIIKQNSFNECPLLYASVINNLQINSITLNQIKYTSVSKNRVLVELEKEIPTKILFDLSEMEKIQINSIQIDQLNANSQLKLLIFQIKHVLEQLNINLSQISNVDIKENQSGVIYLFTGINNVFLKQLSISSIKYLQLLIVQEYKISRISSFSCNSVKIQNCQIMNYIISQSLINTNSLIAQIDDLLLQSITYMSDSQLPAIQIQASDSLIINQSNINQISKFHQSVLKIINSKNILIQGSNFNNIKSQGSGPAISIQDSDDIRIISNYFMVNEANFDSGAIYFKNSISITIKNNSFKKNKSLNGQGGSIYSINSKFIQIDENIFEENNASNGSGGAIYCEQGIILSLSSNKFLYNQAINGSGGSLLLDSCDLQVLNSNEFNSNTAFIGGAIRYLLLKPLFLLNNSMDIIQKQNFFKRNKYVAYGKDIGSYPIILDVKSSYDDDEDKRQVSQINEVQSGYFAKDLIQLRFVDEEMREINIFDVSLYPQVIDDIKNEFSQYILQVDSDQIGLSGDLKQGYSKTAFSFQFNLTYSYKPKSSAQVTIKSTQALPQFLNNNQQMTQKQFEIQLTINFRECQIGEVLQKSYEYTLCQTCELGFYSIVDPYSDTDIICQKCPVGSLLCKGSEINLLNGYWRSSNESDVIVSCGENEFNCLPQNSTSKYGCTEGHIGPLCSECDVLGKVWDKQYALVSATECMDCTNFNSGTNITLFILIFAFILSQIFAKAYKQVTVTKKYIVAVYLAKLGLISPNIEKTQTIQASLMKILLNYFQFVMIVNSLDISLPVYFAAFNLSGGDTSQQTINRIDCFLFGYKTELPNYIIRVLWVNSQPLVLFLFLEILSQFTLQKTQVSAQRQTLYTNLIIVFSFFQPSITKVISQSFSCTRIGDQSYVLADLNENCLTEKHVYYFYTTLLPLGIFWIFFGPLFLLYRMSHYKNQMNNIRIIYRYGYLYQEYNHRHYYWDIIRMFIRSFAIIAINMLNFKVLFKGLIILGLIFCYMLIANKQKPYLLERFNKLDNESCFLVIITLYLLYVGYLSDNIVVSFVTTVFVGIINGKFILKMIQLIFIKPVSPIQGERSRFQNIIYNLKQRIPLLLMWVEIRNPNRTKPFINWKKVRKQVDRIKDMNKEVDQFNQIMGSKRNTNASQMYLISSQRKMETVKLLNNYAETSQDSVRQLLRSRLDTQRQSLFQEPKLY